MLLRYVATAEEAACAALAQGGCDVNSGPVYHDALAQAVSKGLCHDSDVERALNRTLRLRFELGLLDPIDDQP